MDKKLKTKWIKALRSGKYKQGQFVLARENPDGQCYYCCLGVLCEIMKIKYRKPDRTGAICYIFDGTSDICTIPHSYALNIGLDLDVKSKLVGLNDDNKPFAEIADYIEQHVD